MRHRALTLPTLVLLLASAAQAQTAPAIANARMTAGPARSAPTPVSV